MTGYSTERPRPVPPARPQRCGTVTTEVCRQRAADCPDHSPLFAARVPARGDTAERPTTAVDTRLGEVWLQPGNDDNKRHHRPAVPADVGNNPEAGLIISLNPVTNVRVSIHNPGGSQSKNNLQMQMHDPVDLMPTKQA